MIHYCVRQNASVALEYVMCFCKHPGYRDALAKSLKHRVNELYHMMNEMLLDKDVDQARLAETRRLVIDFQYEKYPVITEVRERYQRMELQHKPENEPA